MFCFIYLFIFHLSIQWMLMWTVNLQNYISEPQKQFNTQKYTTCVLYNNICYKSMRYAIIGAFFFSAGYTSRWRQVSEFMSESLIHCLNRFIQKPFRFRNKTSECLYDRVITSLPQLVCSKWWFIHTKQNKTTTNTNKQVTLWV